MPLDSPLFRQNWANSSAEHTSEEATTKCLTYCCPYILQWERREYFILHASLTENKQTLQVKEMQL